jgi:hypothetical protein
LIRAVLTTLEREEEEEENDPDLTRSTLDAVSGYTAAEKGLESLLSQPLGRSLVSKLVFFALDRRMVRGEGVQEFALSSLGRVVEHCAATTVCDALLKPVLFGALADTGLALAEAFKHALTKPEDALRGACYDCLAEVAKTTWGCTEICANKDFIRRIADASSELVPVVSTWRYKCVCSVFTTASESGSGIQNDLVEMLHKSVAAGPYGSGTALKVDTEIG